jgi:hypothetical protein
MASIGYIGASVRGVTFTVANIADLDAIKTTIATAASSQAYTGAALNGASTTPLPDSKTGYAQWPCATASSSAGSYVNGSTIIFTATYKGVAVTRTATVSGTDGGAKFVADGPVDGAVTNVVVGAQTNTSGAWTFGFCDLECVRRGASAQQEPWRNERGGSAGNIGYYDNGGTTQILPCIEGEHHGVQIARLNTDTTTVTSITLYE